MASDGARPRKQIVIGVDGSESSKDALRTGVRLADVLDADATAVISWSTTAAYGEGYVAIDWDPKQMAEKVLTETVDEVFGAHRPSGLKMFIAQGPAATVLISRSQGATLLVVGSRGHGGFIGLLLGSVSSQCAEHASCPVLIVRAGEAIL
jgi:nucleotide-binding universal stress UspA family protein